MFSSSSTAPSVSLQFSLVDNPRTQIEEWYEDVMAKARGLCIQWDLTGAVTLVASDAVWNPGIQCPATSRISNLIDVLARSAAPQYRARPNFDPPAALDPAATATAVESANWMLPGDGYAFRIYTGPKHAFMSVDGRCGTGKQDSLKSRVYPYPSPLPYPPLDCLRSLSLYKLWLWQSLRRTWENL